MKPEKLLESEWDEIKSYLEITEEDERNLGKLGEILLPSLEDIVDAFYEHILSFPSTRRLFADAETAERIKAEQMEYFRRLTRGHYNSDYLKDRTRIGVAHDRIGLKPRWYIGAYRKYVELILPRLCERLSGGEEGLIPYLRSLLKVVFLDMTVALESYLDIREHKLRQSEEHFRSIFEASNDAIFLFAPDYSILDANPAALKMLGLPREEILGKKCHQVVHGSATKCEEVPCTIDQVLRGGDIRGVIHQHYDCQGNAITVEISASGVRDAEGRLVAVVEAARDITPREMAKRELEERIAELERWRRVTVDRELRMAELKEENRRLRQEVERLRKLCVEGEG
jgi:PAS domain S-box-containing protein